MPITDTSAIRFCNEAIRPLAERLRELEANIGAALAWWNSAHAGNTLGAVFTGNLGETVEDGRANEGVSRLSGNDVALVVTQLDTIHTALNQTGVPAIIQKPCVRAMITG